VEQSLNIYIIRKETESSKKHQLYIAQNAKKYLCNEVEKEW